MREFRGVAGRLANASAADLPIPDGGNQAHTHLHPAAVNWPRGQQHRRGCRGIKTFLSLEEPPQSWGQHLKALCHPDLILTRLWNTWATTGWDFLAILLPVRTDRHFLGRVGSQPLSPFPKRPPASVLQGMLAVYLLIGLH